MNPTILWRHTEHRPDPLSQGDPVLHGTDRSCNRLGIEEPMGRQNKRSNISFFATLIRTTVVSTDDLGLHLWCRRSNFSAVLWNRNYFLRFRFRLLKSYGSGSDFWKSYGSGSYFWKVTVPVPVPVPYLYHKKQICFLFHIVSCFTRKKIININKFIVKCERKKF